MAMGLTLAMILAGATSVVSMVLLPVGLTFLSPVIPGDSTIPALLWALRWVVALAAVVMGLGVFYHFGPNTEAARKAPFLTPGLMLAVALWAAQSLAFTRFVGAFGTYNQVYGSLGAGIALMVWFQLSAWVVLIGAALDRVLRLRPRSGETAPPETA